MHKVDNIHLAEFAQYALSERFPESLCKDHYLNLITDEMLVNVIPVK
jgi:hypothetical protein